MVRGGSEFSQFSWLARVSGPIYNLLYGPLLPHRCPKCFESVTLIQLLDKEDMPRRRPRVIACFVGGV